VGVSSEIKFCCSLASAALSVPALVAVLVIFIALSRRGGLCILKLVVASAVLYLYGTLGASTSHGLLRLISINRSQ
jgi:hypothetical protein